MILFGKAPAVAWRAGLRGMVAIGLALATTVAASDDGFKTGQHAFDAGRGADAAAIWQPLARAGSARAQHALGVLYDRGGGRVAPAPSRAARWYQRAAAQGHRDAQTNLGRLYAAGRGVAERPEKAAELWRRAARDGHAVAQYNLAMAYHEGRGVDADARRAARWLKRAARTGLPQAQHALARMYRLGRTLPVDRRLALAWYARAAANGHAAAERQAARLRERGVVRAELGGDLGTPKGEADRRTAAPSRYVVWLGSGPTRAAARQRWSALREQFGATIGRLRLRLRTDANVGPNPITRILAGPFERRAQARAVCADLRARDRRSFCQVRNLGP